MALTRYVFTGGLELVSPLHIGSGHSHELTDSPIRTNVDGRPIVPGTTLGGLLRSQAERFAPLIKVKDVIRKSCVSLDAEKLTELQIKKEPCGCLVCQLFGDVNPAGESDRSSRLVIRDAVLSAKTRNYSTEIRDGIGISRQRQTVAQRLKFDLEVLTDQVEFDFEAILDIDSEDFLQLQLFAAALGELMAGRVMLGGRSGRGTGRFRLRLDKVYPVSFAENDIKGLIEYLQTRPQERHKKRVDAQAGNSFVEKQLAQLRTRMETNAATDKINFIEVKIRLEFDYGLLINNPAYAVLEATDGVFVRTRHKVSGQETLYLPGSSLRGMLRSHAERIARTLSNVKAEEKNLNYAEVVSACDPMAQADETEAGSISGYASISCGHYLQNAALKLRQNNATLDSRAIHEHSCLACRLFGNTYLAGRMKVSDALPVDGKYLDPVALPNRSGTLQHSDYVAIDRFTGGARDKAKFDNSPHFSRPQTTLNFEFTMSLRDLEPEKEDWLLGWLAFVLRDLEWGNLRLGMGKTKGLGLVRGQVMSLTVGGLGSDSHLLKQRGEGATGYLATLEEIKIPSSLFRQQTIYRQTSLNNTEKIAITYFARKFNEEVNKFTRQLPNLEKKEV